MTSAMNGIIAEKDSETARYGKQSTMSPLESAKELWIKTSKSPQVYDEYTFKGNFGKGLPQSCRHNIPACSGSQKFATIKKVVTLSRLLTNRHAAPCLPELLAVYTDKFHKSNNPQLNNHIMTVNSFVSSDNTVQQLAYSGK